MATILYHVSVTFVFFFCLFPNHKVMGTVGIKKQKQSVSYMITLVFIITYFQSVKTQGMNVHTHPSACVD
jgi:hypothetical membrane protein